MVFGKVQNDQAQPEHFYIPICRSHSCADSVLKHRCEMNLTFRITTIIITTPQKQSCSQRHSRIKGDTWFLSSHRAHIKKLHKKLSNYIILHRTVPALKDTLGMLCWNKLNLPRPGISSLCKKHNNMSLLMDKSDGDISGWQNDWKQLIAKHYCESINVLWVTGLLNICSGSA